MNTIIVNLFSGPGAGKSVVAAELFSKLKKHDIETELALEFAKDLVIEERFNTLKNQIYVFGKQLHRVTKLVDKFEVIITDSPLLLSIIYKPDGLSGTFDKLVLEIFNSFNNINYFINRKYNYSTIGRIETESEAKCKDREVKELLIKNGIYYIDLDSSNDGINFMVEDILLKLNKK